MTIEAEESSRARTRRWMLPAAALGALAVVVGLALRARHAPPPAGKSGRATVTLYDEGRPVPDRWIVFHDADGNVTASMKSGADGKASAEVRAGSMITVAYGTSVHQLVTVTAVQPGDEIVVGEREDDEGGAGNTVATAKVKLPGAYPSSARYGVSLGVGTTDVADVAVSLPMPVLRRFLRPHEDVGPGVEHRKFPVLALAFDDKGEALAFAFDWATLGEKDGGDVDVRLPAWSTDWREHRIILSSAPAGLTSVAGELAILSGDDRFERGRREAPIGVDTTLRFSVPRPLGASATYRVELAYGTSGDKAVLTRRVKTMPPEVRLDLRAVLLPRVTGATVEVPRDASRPVVRWVAAGDVAKADATVVRLSWPETREHVWTIIAPGASPRRIEVPELPAALAEWKPDARPVRAAVALVEASFYAGYDDVRKKGIGLVGEPPEDDEVTVSTSVTGDLVF